MKIIPIKILTLTLLLSSCLYSPLSRQFVQWSSDLCGRKTMFERLCTGGIFIVMAPVYLGALIIDLPLSIMEFFFGIAPFKDPLVKTASIDFQEHRFPGKKGNDEWIVQRLIEMPDSFHVRKLSDGVLVEEYVIAPLKGGKFKITAPADSHVSRYFANDFKLVELEN